MGGEFAKCYICAQEGMDSEAVALCIVCGMGLCMEHAIRDDVPFWEGQLIRTEMVEKGGFKPRIPKKLPRILCRECYKVLTP